jgi:type VI secretion system secreted protein Hcp
VGEVRIDEVSPYAGKPMLVRETVLHEAYIMSIEQVTLPNPTNPAQFDEVQRVALAYGGIEWTEYPMNSDGSAGAAISGEATRVQMADVSLPSIDTCESSFTNGPMFMRLGSIPGDSTVAGHAREIEVYDVCSTLGTNVTAHVATGAGSGQLQTAQFAFVKKVDVASPIIYQTMALGQHLNMTKIDFAKFGEKPFTYYSMELTNGFIVGINEYTNSNGDTYERLVMEFDTAKFTYTPQNDDGTSGASVVAEMDFVSRN